MPTRRSPRAVLGWFAAAGIAALAGCNSRESVSSKPPPGDVPTTGPTDPTFVPPAPTTVWVADMSNGKCHAQLQMSSSSGPPPPYPCPSAFPTAGAYSFTIERAPEASTCVARYAKPGTGGSCPPNVPCIVSPPQYLTVDVPCPAP